MSTLPFIWQFLIVMASMIGVDASWTIYFIKVEERKAIQAGIWSAMIMIFGMLVTISYVHDRRLMIAAVMGAFIGTAGTVYLKKQKK